MIWVVMNNCAFGTIAGLQKAHFGTTLGTVFEKDGEPYSPDFAAIARAYGVDGVRIEMRRRVQAGAGSGRRLGQAVRARRDRWRTSPAPTAGHWNIMDIYSPGKKVHHVAT